MKSSQIARARSWRNIAYTHNSGVGSSLDGWSAIGKLTSGLLVTLEERLGMSPNAQMFAQDCSEEELRAVWAIP
jgi:hypothetical protein